MGNRKTVKGEGKPVVLWIGDETLNELDRLCEKLHMSRSRLARNLLERGLEEAKFLDLTGILMMVHRIESLQEQWRERHGMQEATA